MLCTYRVDGQTIDSLDLKVLLVGGGVHVPAEVHAAYGPSRRLSPGPRACNNLFLPDGVPVHLADPGPSALFVLRTGTSNGAGIPGPALLQKGGETITEVDFPPAVSFYSQTTARGVPFGHLAVLQGRDMLAFPYLWTCAYARMGQACRFCHCGHYTQSQPAGPAALDFPFTPEDVAEAAHYAFAVERCARILQMTAGSTLDPDDEIDRYVAILHAIDKRTGLVNIPGDVILYVTPPTDPTRLDRLFEAGATRVACDMDLWDEELALRWCPGKSQWTGRQRHLRALRHVARIHGRGKACSVFVVGLEPAESYLVGAEKLARDGIVPLPSVWLPHGLPGDLPPTPGLDYYRTIKAGMADIYTRYGTEPPGDGGSNVCLSRDLWNHRAEVLALA